MINSLIDSKDAEGKFTLAPLPYTDDYLEPFISEKTLRYHYGKHLKTYIDNVNELSIKWKEKPSIEYLINSSYGVNTKLFQNSSQVFNHYFYFEALNKNGEKRPYGKTLELINKSFRNFDHFKEKFLAVGKSVFGSGWVWLLQRRDGLIILPTIGAGIPLHYQEHPLMCMDMWEHAYYLDYKNDKTAYIEAFFNIIDWSVVESRIKIW